jgi:hypothetical protein
MELLTNVQPRIFATLHPSKVVDLFKLGDGTPPKAGIRTAEVVSGFYSFLGFTRLTVEGVIRRAISQGVEKRVLGYTTGTPKLGDDGHYQIDRSKVAYDQFLAEDEVDLQSGFLIFPAALPLVATPSISPDPQPPDSGSTPPDTGPDAGARVGSGGGSSPPTGIVPQKLVELAFNADRNQLFTAWNALANLADLAGEIKITIRASSDIGFDRTKLENGVLEPLREAKLIE